MPYDPHAITTDDRTYAYKAMWIGLPMSIILVISMQFEAFSQLTTIVGGFVCGLFIGQAWSWRYDEFQQKEIAFASGWALSLAGIILFLAILPSSFGVVIEADLAIAIMALVFHAAIYYHRLRNGELWGGAG